MDAPPRFDCDHAQKTLLKGSSFWNLQSNLLLMLAQTRINLLYYRRALSSFLNNL
jgi:hypothetical protein